MPGSAGVLWVSVRPSLEGFGADLRRQIEQSVPPEIRVRIRPDGDPAQDGARSAGAFADAFRARIAAALRDLPRVELNADSSPAEREIAALRTRLEALRSVRVGVDLDAETFRTRVREVEADLERLSRSSPDVQIRADAAAALAELRAAQAEVDELDGKTARVDVDTTAATSNMNKLLTVGLSLAPALIPIGAAIAAGLASIGPAALAAAGGLASIGLAFGGVTKAIQAGDAAQQSAGQSAGRSASQEANAASQIASAKDQIASAERSLAQARAQAADGAISAAERVAGAERQIQDAQRNSAQGAEQAARRVQDAEQAAAKARSDAAYQAEQSARQVANAQQAVVAAQEQAAASVQSAINTQISAEQSLAQAQRQEQTAQENLTQARKDAAQALRDLSFSVEDNALNQRAAALQLQQAQQNQAGLGNGATQLQRDQAQLAVDQAQQRIKELDAQGKDLAAQKADADKRGVEGSKQVTSAQQAVTDSIQRTADAERALQQANDNVVKAQRDGARQVAAAQQSLADAREQQVRQAAASQDAIRRADRQVADAQQAQANQRITSQEQIQKAEQALADARRAQAMQRMTAANSIASAEQGVVSAQRALDSAQRSAAQSATGADTATKKYEEALKKLSPAGREFVAFYQSTLKPKFDEIAKAAQSGLLPGLQDGIKAALPGFDQLKTFITNVSTAIGNLARDAGAALTKPFWHDFFDFMNRTAGPTIETLGRAFGNFIQGAAGIMQALYQPVFVPMMNWFKELSERVKNFGTSAAAGTNSSFNAFLQYVRDNGPKVRDLIGAVKDIIVKLIEGLAGQGATTLSALTFALQVIASLPPPVLAAFYDAVVALRLFVLAGQGIAAATTMISTIAGINWAAVGSAFTSMGRFLASPALKGGLFAALGIGAALIGIDQLGQKLHELAGDMPDGKGGWIPNDKTTTGQSFAQAGASAADKTVSGGELGQIGHTLTTGEMSFGPSGDQLRNSPIGRALNLTGVRDAVQKWFADMKRDFPKWWDDNVAKPTSDFFSKLPGRVSKWWEDNVWNPTRDFFTKLPGTIGKWWEDNVSRPTSEFFSKLPGRVSKWWTDNIWNPTRDFFTKLPGTISKWWEDNVSKPTGEFFAKLPGRVSQWWNDNIWNPTRDFFTKLPGTISKWWEDNVSKPTGEFFSKLPARVSQWWNDNIATPTGNFFKGLPATVRKWWDDNVTTPLSQSATAMWDGIVRAFKHGVNLIAGAIRSFDGKVNVVFRAVGLGNLLDETFPDPFPGFAGGGVLPGYAPGVDSIPAMLSPGEAVLVPELVRAIGPQQILQMNAQASGRAPGSASMPRFAGGGVLADFGSGLSDLATWISGGVAGIVAKVKAAFTGTDMFSKVGAGVVSSLVPAISKKITDTFNVLHIGETGQGAITGGRITGGVERWRGVVLQALGIAGQPAALADTTLRRMNQESGGNPTIVNTWDSNAKRGTPSVGLMQVIGPTYRANDQWRDVGPYLYGVSTEPLSNILASMHYAIGRYGSLSAAYNKAGGYARGGIVDKPELAWVGEDGPEAILPLGPHRDDRLRELARDSRVASALGVGKQSGVDMSRVIASSAQMTSEIRELRKEFKKRGVGGAVNVYDRSGDASETARQTVLALRLR